MSNDNVPECGSPKEWQRFYLGYRERFVDDCCIPLTNGKEVRLRQAPSAKQFRQPGGSKQHKQQQRQQTDLDKQSDPALTGSTVWDGALVLAQYLSSRESPLHQYRAARAEAISRDTLALGPTPASAQTSQKDNHMQQHSLQQPCVSQADQPCAEQRNGTAYLSQQDAQQLQEREQPGAQQAALPLPGFTCLELGAGTGAVSLCLLAAGSVDFAVLTDIPDMLPHLQSNVEHNSTVLHPQHALVLPLRWAAEGDVAALQQLGQQRKHWRGDTRRQMAHAHTQPQLQPPFELIVGSDLIYYSYTSSTPHSRLLLQALVQLAGPDSLIFLALSLHHNPEEVHAFLEWAESDWGFAVHRVTDGVPAEYVVPDVLVVRLQLVDVHKAQQAAAAAANGTLHRKGVEQ